MKQRESFSSRLGFLLISAGCAIGLGNVWRFPYITGQYGGAAFVVVYLLFLVVVVGSMLVVSRGLQNGVEKINKAMMLCLLAVMVLLAVRSLTLEGGMEGLAFYLMPNFHNLMYDAQGNFILWEAIYAAMGQAFFTLSLGIGALAIFGSYIGKEHTLPGEALRAGLQPVERLPASGGWHLHHGFGGLPGQR